MDITPLIRADRQIIQSYSAGGFKVSGKEFKGPVVVFPDRVEPWEFSGNIDALKADDFRPLLDAAADIDVALLGCGESMQFVPPSVKKPLAENNIALETMDTGAACRTYNVLMAEGRRVAVMLVPV